MAITEKAACSANFNFDNFRIADDSGSKLDLNDGVWFTITTSYTHKESDQSITCPKPELKSTFSSVKTALELSPNPVDTMQRIIAQAKRISGFSINEKKLLFEAEEIAKQQLLEKSSD